MTEHREVIDKLSIFDPQLLSRCISCGFCLPSCPTYKLTGDEASSPRGRITLMRALQDGSLPADDATLREQSSFCLGCRACEPVCPAGVQYGQLLEQWRVHQWRGRRRPLRARALTTLAGQRWLVWLMGVVRRSASTRPGRSTASSAGATSAGAAGSGAYLMLGCFERGMFPAVSRAARRLLPGLSAPAAQGCCGALHAHNGDMTTGERLAHQLGERLAGTIVTTSGGCAAHLAPALGVDRVRELSDYLVEQKALAAAIPQATSRGTAVSEVRVDGRRARVTLQDSCHLRNGLGVSAQPRQLLREAADYVELPGAGTCCGAAGTYSLLRPADSRKVLDPKLDAIEEAGVDYVVAVNPGCLRQLRTGLRRRGSKVRAIHIAELLDKASSDTPANHHTS